MNTGMTLADLTNISDFAVRIRAITDYQMAVEARHTAHRELRWKMPAWRLIHRLELRRAIRAWRHYANAIRRGRTNG